MKLGIAPQRDGKLMPPGYRFYMQSSVWARKRKAVLTRALHRCDHCAAEGVPLEVHHKTYRRFGREAMEDLEALCGECHRKADFQRKRRAERARAKR